MMQFATEEEIREAHAVLFPGKPFFEADKLDVIRCNESRDIKACPGSGKTSVLLAKLAILSNRMPFSDGSGVCVLTHTNVAIDEIKSRLGDKSDILLGYPNFCGTIQSFVDQFFAKPFFNSFWNCPIDAINSERAEKIILEEYWKFFREKKKEEKHFLYGFVDVNNYKVGKEINWNDVHFAIGNVIKDVYYDYTLKKFYTKYGANRCLAANKNGAQSPTLSFLMRVRRAPERYGIIKYEDAYALALAYLSLVPGIRDALSSRFRYVFIDETQDSSDLQLACLDALFDRKKVVVQRFGDPYQAIYNYKTEKECAWTPINPLPLNKSKRFGPSIANVLKTVCVTDNREMEGNDAVPSLKPVMIVYSEGKKVLPAFAELLREKRIIGISVADLAKNEKEQDPLRRVNIKAIGFVGKKKGENGKESIHNYFPQFENQTIENNVLGENISLNSFLQKNAVNDEPQEYRNHILDAMVTVLVQANKRKGNGRFFSKTSMLDYLEANASMTYESLIASLPGWVLKMSNSDTSVDLGVFEEVKSFISNDFAAAFELNIEAEPVRLFLQKREDGFYQLKNQEQSQNLYRDGEIEIQVSTVHSVKGETHAATLFLETKNYKYESEHLGAQLCGEPFRQRKGDSNVLQALKIAYVALSRPKYLLAYAIHKDRFQLLDKGKLEQIWEIKNVE